jgi:hypothetical protein
MAEEGKAPFPRRRRLSPMEKIAREARAHSLTPATKKLLNAAESIQLDPGTREDAAFMHVVLCHLGMPRSKTPERVFERIYERSNFRCALRMEAGSLWNGKTFEEHPLPYGVKPRIAFMHLVTTAIKTGSPEVEVADSVRQYMLRLGFDPQGSEYRSFRKQMLALAATRMQLGMTYPNGDVLHVNAQPIHKFQAWISPDASNQPALWPGIITLSQDFYQGLRGSLVPIDERAAAALDGALELDIYFWLAQRLCRIHDGKGQFITWHALKDQFAPKYKHLFSFKQQFLIALRQVHRVYPDAHIDYTSAERGIWLFASRSPIPKSVLTSS